MDVAFSECFTQSKGHPAEAYNMSLMFGMLVNFWLNASIDESGIQNSTLDILDTDPADAKAIKHLESLGLALCERASDKINPYSAWKLTEAGNDSWRPAFAVHSGKSLRHCNKGCIVDSCGLLGHIA